MFLSYSTTETVSANNQIEKTTTKQKPVLLGRKCQATQGLGPALPEFPPLSLFTWYWFEVSKDKRFFFHESCLAAASHKSQEGGLIVSFWPQLRFLACTSTEKTEKSAVHETPESGFAPRFNSKISWSGHGEISPGHSCISSLSFFLSHAHKHGNME